MSTARNPNRPANNSPEGARLPIARAAPHAQALPYATRRPVPVLRVLVPAAVVLALSPVVPATAWWLGLALLAMCAAAVARTAGERFGWLSEASLDSTAGRAISAVQGGSRRVLGLADCQPWPMASRLATYGLAGVVLVAAGAAVQRSRVERERQAVAAAEREAEQRAKVERANAELAKHCRNARAVAADGKHDWALQLLELAAGTADATDHSQVSAARTVVADYRTQYLLDQAEEMLDGSDIEAASRLVREALVVPHATDPGRAKSLESHIRMATDPERVQAVLVAVPDDQFDRLRGGGPLPPDLTSDFRVLESRARSLAESGYAAAAEARKAQRAAERRRLEEERLADDAAQHRQADAAAAREAERKRREAVPAEGQQEGNVSVAGGGPGATYVGPRGGRYHYTATGKKSYERQGGGRRR